MRTRKQNSVLRRSNKIESERNYKNGGINRINVTPEQIEDFKNFKSLNVQKMEHEMLQLIWDQRKAYKKEYAESITEAGRRYMKEALGVMPNFLIDYNYDIIKGKQIFSKLDPYGEENWDE